MSLRSRWSRTDAEHWVLRILQTQAFLLVLWTMWSVVVGLAYGVVLVAVIPASVAVAAGWLASAWRRERPWAWWVATLVAGVGCAGSLVGLLGGDVFAPVPLLFHGVLLALLFHRDSRARVDRAAAEQPRATVP